MNYPLNWTHPVAELTAPVPACERTATPDERHRCAQALELLDCSHLAASYEIVPIGEGRYRVAGRFQADVVQSCVVTLEPVAAHIEDVFDVEFWPAVPQERESEREIEVLSGVDPEPIGPAGIDIGRIVYEYLSAALDPYPRKEGAQFQWQEPAGEDAGSGAFAPLAALKKRG